MGQIFSKLFKKEIKTIENDPYTLLDVSELTKIEKTKKNYQKLFYLNQRNLVLLTEINKAFQFIKDNVDLDLYIEIYSKIYPKLSNKKDMKKEQNNLFITEIKQNVDLPKRVQIIQKGENIIIIYKNIEYAYDFIETSNDLFQKISVALDIKHTPKVTEPNFNTFWSRFKSNDFELEKKVRKLSEIIKKVKNEVKTDENVEIKEVKIVKKESKKSEKYWKIQCTACNKGFNNKNTLNDHLKSKKHKENSLSENDIIFNQKIEDSIN